MSKDTLEKQAEDEYKKVLKNIIYPLLGKKTTWAKDLDKIGLKLFGKNYVGSFPSDMIPDLGINMDGQKTTKDNVNKFSKLYSIINLDNSSQPGSHWLGLAFDANTRNIWVYDSYGRKTVQIIPSLVKKYGDRVKTVQRDVEQAILAEDCGARSMAWLYIFDRYGSDVAKFI